MGHVFLSSLSATSTTPKTENPIVYLFLLYLSQFDELQHTLPYIFVWNAFPHTTLLDFHNHRTEITATFHQRRMDDTSQLDGSDGVSGASTQAQLVSALKEHLNSAILILDAFDQSSFSSLSTDKEYKDLVQCLLSPLTTLSLSSVVDQANQVLKSGLDAISTRMSAIVDSPHPSTIVRGSLLRQSETTFTTPTPRPNPYLEPQRAPGPHTSVAPGPQLSPLATLRNDTSKASDVMITIHFLTGFCRPTANMERLVTTVNGCMGLRTPQHGQSSFSGTSLVVVEAQPSTNGDRIVLGINPGTFKIADVTNMIQVFDLSAFFYPGSVTRVRRGGTVEYAVRLKNVPQRIYSSFSPSLIRQTEAYLAMTWGQAIRLTTRISPLVYLCEGPKYALDRFCAAPAGSFDLHLDYSGSSQRLKFPGITVEGICLSDVFDFV